jgi:hypothetical protein
VSDRLVSSLVTRVEETLEDVGDRFPVYADPASGRWHATDEPDWNGGFWPALLWLTAEDTAATAVAGGLALAGAFVPAGRHLGPRGGLVDGCYNARQGLAARNELIWGDYFALEAALARQGQLETAVL